VLFGHLEPMWIERFCTRLDNASKGSCVCVTISLRVHSYYRGIDREIMVLSASGYCDPIKTQSKDADVIVKDAEKPPYKADRNGG
jgi:hypothetical protein